MSACSVLVPSSASLPFPTLVNNLPSGSGTVPIGTVGETSVVVVPAFSLPYCSANPLVCVTTSIFGGATSAIQFNAVVTNAGTSDATLALSALSTGATLTAATIFVWRVLSL